MAAATDTGLTEMRVSKVVGFRGPDDHTVEAIVLDQADGNRHLVIQVGATEAFSLAATLGGISWRRPMTYQFATALVDSLGGRIRQVRIDRIVEGAYAATVEVDGPLGTGLVDARASDALNLAVLTGTPVFAATVVLDDNERELANATAQAEALRRAVELPPITVTPGRPGEP